MWAFWFIQRGRKWWYFQFECLKLENAPSHPKKSHPSPKTTQKIKYTTKKTHVDAQPINGFSQRSRESNSIFQWSKLLVPLCMAFFVGRLIRTRRETVCSSGTPVSGVKSFWNFKKTKNIHYSIQFKINSKFAQNQLSLISAAKMTTTKCLFSQSVTWSMATHLHRNSNIFWLIFSIAQRLFIAKNVCVVHNWCFLVFGGIVYIVRRHFVDFTAIPSNSTSVKMYNRNVKMDFSLRQYFSQLKTIP